MSSTLDLIRSKKTEIQNQTGQRANTVKPGTGKSRWRILPSWRDESEGPQPFWHDFGVHFIRESLDEKPKAVHMCVAKTYGQPCPICEIIEDGIARADDDHMIELLKQAKAQGRVLVNALQVDGTEPDKVVILDLTFTTFEKVLDRFEDAIEEAKEDGDADYQPLSLKNGVDIVINRTGTGLNTKYDVSTRKGKPVDESILEELHDLDKHVAQNNTEKRNLAISTAKTISGSTMKTLPSGVSEPAPTTKSGSILEGDFTEEEVAEEVVEEVSAEEEVIPDSDLDDLMNELD